VVSEGALVFASAIGTRSYTDIETGATASYETATWTSPVVDPGHPYTELVASWNATTPDGSWIEVRVRAVADDGTEVWHVLGRWASDDVNDGGAINRTSQNGQANAYATVYTDTLAALNDHTLRTWQLEVTLLRRSGTSVVPSVRLVSAMASGLPKDKKVPVSALGPASLRAIDLAVPTYSQELHKGHYPEYDNGGEAWCSSTSTAMVVGFWGTGPSAADTAWVDPPVDSVVDIRGPQRLRLHLRRVRQLAVQHGVCSSLRPGGVRNAAALVGRGGAVHRGRDPARRLGVVQQGRAEGGRVQHQRAPDGHSRLHRIRRRHRE
jgi:hypothetical protein